MINFIFIAVCMTAGYVIRHSGLTTTGAHKGVNAWILYIALPACFLRYIPHVHWVKETMLPCLAPVLVWIGSWLFVSWYCHKRNVSRQTRGAMKLTAGLSNTAFLGFIAVFYSESEIKIAILFDQTSFILLSSIGVVTAIRESGKQSPGLPVVIKRLIRFPPLLACLLAILLTIWCIDLSALNPLLDKITATVGPMALFSIGLQLEFAAIPKQWKHLVAALTYKLMIAPLLVLIVVIITGLKGPIAQISVFEAAMPTLATASVLADEYGLDAELASLVVSMSMVVSFMTMGFWWWIER